MDDELETEQKEQANNSRAGHLQPWLFKKGQSGNPKGRPPGKSLKERAKAMLNAMTEEEEQIFLAGLDKRVIWEMAEGKPQTNTDITSGGNAIPLNLIHYGDIKPPVHTERLPDTSSPSV